MRKGFALAAAASKRHRTAKNQWRTLNYPRKNGADYTEKSTQSPYGAAIRSLTLPAISNIFRAALMVRRSSMCNR
jgi:hypothetical protein